MGSTGQGRVIAGPGAAGMAGRYLPARDISCVPGLPRPARHQRQENSINQGQFGLSAQQMGR